MEKITQRHNPGNRGINQNLEQKLGDDWLLPWGPQVQEISPSPLTLRAYAREKTTASQKLPRQQLIRVLFPGFEKPADHLLRAGAG